MTIDGIFLLVLVIAALVAGGRWLLRQYEIDTCLDSGGRINKTTEQCEGGGP